MNPRTQTTSSTEDASAQPEHKTDEFLNSLGFGADAMQELDELDLEDGPIDGIMLSSQPDDLSLPGADGYQIPKRFGLDDLQEDILPDKKKSADEGEQPKISEPESDTGEAVDSKPAQDFPGSQKIDDPEEALPDTGLSGNGVDEIIDSSVSFAIPPTAKVEVPEPGADPEISDQSNSVPVADQAEAEEEETEEEDLSLALNCPSCKGELILMPEHLGIQGNCVWCDIPIIAAKSAADGAVGVFAVQTGEKTSPKEEASEEIEEPTAQQPDIEPADPVEAVEEAEVEEKPVDEIQSGETPGEPIAPSYSGGSASTVPATPAVPVEPFSATPPESAASPETPAQPEATTPVEPTPPAAPLEPISSAPLDPAPAAAPPAEPAAPAAPVEKKMTFEGALPVITPGVPQGWAPVYAALPQDKSGQSVLSQSLSASPGASQSGLGDDEEEVLPMSMGQPFFTDEDSPPPAWSPPQTPPEESTSPVAAETAAASVSPASRGFEAPVNPVPTNPEPAPVATPEPVVESIFYADPVEDAPPSAPSPEPEAVSEVVPEQATPFAQTPGPVSEPAPVAKEETPPAGEPAGFAQISPFGSPLPEVKEEENSPGSPFTATTEEKKAAEPSPSIPAEAEVLENTKHVPEGEEEGQASPWGQPFQAIAVPAELPRSSVPPKDESDPAPATPSSLSDLQQSAPEKETPVEEEKSVWAAASPSPSPPSTIASPEKAPEEVKPDAEPKGFGALRPAPSDTDNFPSPFANLPAVESTPDETVEDAVAAPVEEPPAEPAFTPPVDPPKESPEEKQESKLPYDPNDPDLPPEDPPKKKTKYGTSSGFSPDNPPPADAGLPVSAPSSDGAPAKKSSAPASANQPSSQNQSEKKGKSMTMLLVIMGLVTGICVASFLLPVEQYIGKARMYLDEKLNLSPADPVVAPVAPPTQPVPQGTGSSASSKSFSPLPAPPQPKPPNSP